MNLLVGLWLCGSTKAGEGRVSVGMCFPDDEMCVFIAISVIFSGKNAKHTFVHVSAL